MLPNFSDASSAAMRVLAEAVEETSCLEHERLPFSVRSLTANFTRNVKHVKLLI